MSRTEPSKSGEFLVEVVTPAERAKYDPPLAEWLALRAATEGYRCPFCDSSHFGTVNPRGYLQTLRCHDEHGIGCRERYRPNPDCPSTLLDELAKAIRGVETRYTIGLLDGESAKAKAD